MPRQNSLHLLLAALLLPWLKPAAMAQPASEPRLEELAEKNRHFQVIQYLNEKLEQPRDSLTAEVKQYYHLRLSQSYHRLARFRHSKSHALKALAIAPRNIDSSRIFEARHVLLSASLALREFQGIGSQAEALKDFASRSSNKALLRDYHNLLGTLYFVKGEGELARQHKKEALDISRGLGPSFNLAQDEITYGLTMLQLNPDSCRVHLEIARDLAATLKDTFAQAITCVIFGYYYIAVNDMGNWIANSRQCIDRCAEIKHYNYVAHAYGHLLTYELARDNHNQAIAYGEQGLKALRQGNADPDYYLEAYLDSLMYVAHKAAGDPAAALSHLENFSKNQGAYLRSEQKSSLEDLETLHSFQKQELLVKNQELSLKVSEKRMQLLVVNNLILVVLLLAALLARHTRRRHAAVLYDREKKTDLLLDALNHGKKDAPGRPGGVSPIQDTQHPPAPHQEQPPAAEGRKDLFEEMLGLIESRKLYLDPELDKNQVISLLGTNRYYLFQALNQHSDSSFREIINGYRVSEAKFVIKGHCDEHGNDHLPENLFSRAGFNSKRTFYRVFKNATGLTPKEYAWSYSRDRQR